MKKSSNKTANFIIIIFNKVYKNNKHLLTLKHNKIYKIKIED